MYLKKLVILVVLSSVGCVASVSKTNQGYLQLDSKKPLSCYNLPTNKECPASLISYQIPDAAPSGNYTQHILQKVKLGLKKLEFFNVSAACRDEIQKYLCSNNMMKCVVDKNAKPFGLKLTYEVKITQAACERAKASCSKEVIAAVAYGCSVINTNPLDYVTCKNIPSVPGDVCPSSSYTHPKAVATFYPKLLAGLKIGLAKVAKKSPLPDDTCKKEFIGLSCKIMRGGICSKDMTLRMSDISKQKCDSVAQRCISDNKIKEYVLEMCKLFPENTAKRVPLPSVGTAPNAVNSGK